ncbi:MAG: response regulator transcription factor [Candidatus Krumholzibacteriota bacterium]|nr:response regulator transcription factor [Candidatus Krumholzibacteriota bacterium]
MKKNDKILVISGDREKLDEFMEPLRRAGFDPVGISEPDPAREAYNRTRYAMVLVRWSSSNIRFCKWIRSIDHNTPIILVCDRKNDCNLAEALEIGCDDYIAAPFKTSELIIRIRMVIRRLKRAERNAMNRTRDLVIESDNLIIDTLKRQVTVDGRTVELTVTEFNILSTLASHTGRAYTRRDILNLLWDDDAEVYEHTINSHINRLRSKIEKDPGSPEHILTVWGVGYRFAGGQA